MNKIVKMVIEKFSRSYTEYRFDKISNFLTYEQFQEKEAIDSIISLGEELQRIKYFKNKTNEELQALYDKWHEVSGDIDEELSVELANKIFAKKQGIDASYELRRREQEERWSKERSA